MPLPVQTVQHLPQAWINAWNAHDLEAILTHYATDIVFHSPFVTKLLGEPSGVVRGKAALLDYFARGLAAYPALIFDLRHVLVGNDSLTLYYQSVGGRMAAEVLFFNTEGEINQVFAHYTDPAA